MAETPWLARPLIRGQEYEDLKQQSVDTFTLAAYGGLHYSGAGHAYGTIDGTWSDIDFLNTLSVSGARGITPDIPSSSLEIDIPGVYILTMGMSFGHDEVNNGRTTALRIYDTIAGQPGNETVFGTGRNVGVTTFTASVMFEVTAATEDHALIVQIGGHDSYSSVVFYNFVYSLHSIGEFRGLF